MESNRNRIFSKSPSSFRGILNEGFMIIDAFTFNNELLLLEARLEELNSVVDYFILVESSYTQSRKSKPLYFEDNKHLFEKFKDKIIHVVFQELTRGYEGNWLQEHAQRNHINFGINQLFREKNIRLDSQDIWVCIGDLDEIPKKEAILEAVKEKYDMVSLNHIFCSYFLNLYNERQWYGTVISKLDNLIYNSPQQIREMKDNGMPHINNAGWHFSSAFGYDFDLLWSKYISCIEPNWKSELINENKEMYRNQYIEHVIKNKYFWYVDNWSDLSLKLDLLPLDKLPNFIQIHAHDKFKNLLLSYSESKEE